MSGRDSETFGDIARISSRAVAMSARSVSSNVETGAGSFVPRWRVRPEIPFSSRDACASFRKGSTRPVRARSSVSLAGFANAGFAVAVPVSPASRRTTLASKIPERFSSSPRNRVGDAAILLATRFARGEGALARMATYTSFPSEVGMTSSAVCPATLRASGSAPFAASHDTTGHRRCAAATCSAVSPLASAVLASTNLSGAPPASPCSSTRRTADRFPRAAAVKSAETRDVMASRADFESRALGC